MKKEFCDRCGSELHMGGVYRFMFRPWVLRFFAVDHGAWAATESHVLCAKCRHALEDWMHDAPKEDA